MSKLTDCRKIVSLLVIVALLLYMNVPLPGQTTNGDIETQLGKARNEYNNELYNLVEFRCLRVISTLSDRKETNFRTLGQYHILVGAVMEKEKHIEGARKHYIIARDKYDTRRVDGVNLDDLPIYQNECNPGGKIEKEGDPPGKNFPWLLVICGVIVVGVTLYLLLKKSERKYTLTISGHDGVVGYPAFDSYRHKSGTRVSYEYNERNGYQSITVFLDDQPVDNKGEILMDRFHILSFSAEPNVYRIVTDRNSLNITEGQTASFHVWLTKAPAQNVTVTTTYLSGDSNIRVSNGSTLTFTPDSYGPEDKQTVTLEALEDDNITDETAQFKIESPGLTPITIEAAAIDNDKDQTLNVNITDPEDNETVSGARIKIQAQASSQKGIEKVEFFIGNDPLATVHNEPYKTYWDSTKVSDGPYTIKAVAHDIAGQTVENTSTVRVNNINDRYQLTVDLGDGVTGFPVERTKRYDSGETVNYQYQPKVGYDNLVILLDGQTVENPGTITMNQDHVLTARAEITQYTLTVHLDTGVTGTPGSGIHYKLANDTVHYKYEAPGNEENLRVFLGGKSVQTEGNFKMDDDFTLSAIIRKMVFITDKESLSIIEGRTGEINVKLSNEPEQDVNVTISLQENNGSNNLHLVTDSPITFTPTDWNREQTVKIQAKWFDNQPGNPIAKLRIEAGDIPAEEIDIYCIPDNRPHVRFESPQDLANVSGNVEIRVSAEDDHGISKIDLYIGDKLKATSPDKILIHNWSTSEVEPGEHILRVKAYDDADQHYETTITVTVINEAPTIEGITIEPESGTAAPGETITVTGTAADDRGIQSIRLLLDNQEKDSKTDCAESPCPFTLQLQTADLTPGNYTLIVEVTDTNDEKTTSAPFNITITN